jgi:hypothetical protein
MLAAESHIWWWASGGRPVQVTRGTSVRINEDGTAMAVFDHGLTVFHLAGSFSDGRLTKGQRVSSTNPRCLEFSPDGKRFLCFQRTMMSAARLVELETLHWRRRHDWGCLARGDGFGNSIGWVPA